MMLHLQNYYEEKYPGSGFSAVWNQIECLPHVINLAAQKEPIYMDNYIDSNHSDEIVSALSRLKLYHKKNQKISKNTTSDGKKMQRQSCDTVLVKDKGVIFLVPIIDVRMTCFRTSPNRYPH